MKTLKNVGIFTEPEGLSVLYSNNRTKQIQVRLKAQFLASRPYI